VAKENGTQPLDGIFQKAVKMMTIILQDSADPVEIVCDLPIVKEGGEMHLPKDYGEFRGVLEIQSNGCFNDRSHFSG
jgi:hypothetical protein